MVFFFAAAKSALLMILDREISSVTILLMNCPMTLWSWSGENITATACKSRNTLLREERKCRSTALALARHRLLGWCIFKRRVCTVGPCYIQTLLVKLFRRYAVANVFVTNIGQMVRSGFGSLTDVLEVASTETSIATALKNLKDNT